jgi:hypothetical protein
VLSVRFRKAIPTGVARRGAMRQRSGRARSRRISGGRSNGRARRIDRQPGARPRPAASAASSPGGDESALAGRSFTTSPHRGALQAPASRSGSSGPAASSRPGHHEARPARRRRKTMRRMMAIFMASPPGARISRGMSLCLVGSFASRAIGWRSPRRSPHGTVPAGELGEWPRPAAGFSLHSLPRRQPPQGIAPSQNSC